MKFNRLKTKNNVKTAPVQVVFSTEDDKWKVLKSSKKLKISRTYKGVFINLDLTKLKLEATIKLNKDRKALNEKLSFEENNKKYG